MVPVNPAQSAENAHSPPFRGEIGKLGNIEWHYVVAAPRGPSVVFSLGGTDKLPQLVSDSETLAMRTTDKQVCQWHPAGLSWK
jgi:hypothetical protein